MNHQRIPPALVADDIKTLQYMLKRIKSRMPTRFESAHERISNLLRITDELVGLCVQLYLTRASGKELESMEELKLKRIETLKCCRIYDELMMKKKEASDYELKHKIQLKIEKDLNVALSRAHLLTIDSKIKCCRLYGEMLEILTPKFTEYLLDLDRRIGNK